MKFWQHRISRTRNSSNRHYKHPGLLEAFKRRERGIVVYPSTPKSPELLAHLARKKAAVWAALELRKALKKAK